MKYYFVKIKAQQLTKKRDVGEEKRFRRIRV